MGGFDDEDLRRGNPERTLRRVDRRCSHRMQATFVARYVEPWTAVKGPDFGIGVGGDSISTFNAQN